MDGIFVIMSSVVAFGPIVVEPPVRNSSTQSTTSWSLFGSMPFVNLVEQPSHQCNFCAF